MLSNPRSVPTLAYLNARAAGDRATEDDFHTRLKLRNGVTRMTRAHRMDDLLPPIVERARAFAGRPLRVLDVACSAGISTVEMHDALRAADLACEVHGTDILMNASLVSRADGCRLLFDHERQVLQAEVGPWASPWRQRRLDLLLHPLSSARTALLLRQARDFRAALGTQVRGYETQQVPLFTSLATTRPAIRFAEEDILQPRVPGRFAIIRAANILNLAYFGRARLLEMVAALSARLEEDGVLLVVRTERERKLNRATFFRFHGGRLSVETSLHGGSELEALIMTTR